MLFIKCLIVYFVVISVESTIDTVPHNVNGTKLRTRRILGGQPAGDTKPYMVYLRAAPNADAKILETKWLCGGVIIHERYILTSAACIEDVKHFYVVSGTFKWHSAHETDECIRNGAKRAVWKCVPKAYFFDGDEFDNIRWMVGDIAVVKVEDNFNFERRVKGCDFIPSKVDFNNHSTENEKPGTMASIAGWGSIEKYGDPKSTVNSPELLETDVYTISKRNCKKAWEQRYHFIIDEHMICTSDYVDEEAISTVCLEREVNCKELTYDHDNEDQLDDATQPDRRMIVNPSAYHYNKTRRSKTSGGFCENDHGGPLIVGQGHSSMVIGIMSACLTHNISRICHGPFLYTSVYRYRNLISCAIDKDIAPTCKKLLRSAKSPMFETFFNWSNHTDGLGLYDGAARSNFKKKGSRTTTRTAAETKSFKSSGHYSSLAPETMLVML